MWQVWDALTGEELFELKHRKIVRAADWSADSAHIVTGAWKPSHAAWTPRPRHPARTTTAHEGFVVGKVSV